jgi:hypothetical protein
MNYNEPSAEVIARVKRDFADRSIHLVEAVDGDENKDGDIYFFVMTGPLRDEYKKYIDEVLSAREGKDEKAVGEGVRAAIERLALGQIRHPDRDEVKRIFNIKPALIQNFAVPLQNAAGDAIEVRSKKL